MTSLLRDALGRVTSQTDANGNTTTYTFDTLGRIAKQTDASGGETRFGYDSRGNLTSLTDPNGNATRFEYDLAGRKTKEIRPMGQVAEYGYYPNGLLKTVKDAKNQTTTYAYDTANRLAEVLYADGKKDTFGYDAGGNMTSYAKEGVSETITYDELNRKTSETVNYGTFSKTFSYSYDNRGNKASFTTPEGKVYTYSYNKNSQPTAIGFDGKTIQLDYQANRLVKQTLPNGVATDFQYNAASWLAAITTKNATATLANSQYGFDKVGNITGKTTEQGSHSYGYDPTYQLNSAIHPTLPAEVFSYDKTGNRTNSGYSHNANNELTAGNGASFTYDLSGNTTQKKVGEELTGYTYNSADRLESVQLPDGRIATYTYDPFGRRIRKDVAGEVTYFVYADEGLIGEYDAQGNQQKGYGWKPDGTWGTNPVFMLEDGNYYFYQNDHLGTPQKLTDEAGNIVWSADYTAFGQANVEPASTVTNNLRFPGQYWDEETGLHWNWHRYYDPNSGRYLESDPIGMKGGLNIYRYALNTPTTFFDEDGLNPGPIHPGNGPFGVVDVRSGNGIIDHTVLGALNTVANTANLVANKLWPIVDFMGSDDMVALTQATPPMPWLPDDIPVTIFTGLSKLGKVAKGAQCEKTQLSVQDKLLRYLLNLNHPKGKDKAIWFEKALGFTISNADDLAKQIIFNPEHAVVKEVTQHGTIYNQVISITGANGKVIDVTFAWIRNNDGIVRLVTAVPAKR